MTDENNVTKILINKGMFLKLQNIQNNNLKNITESLFKQLRDYFLMVMTALLLCEINMNDDKMNDINNIMSTIIGEILFIDAESNEFNDNLQLFLSIIISKRGWNFLFELLKSQHCQRWNDQWTIKLCQSLALQQITKQAQHLEFYHQIQFTLSSKPDSSIFPHLHQPYEELRQIISQCVTDNSEGNQWGDLVNWIQSKLDTVPVQLEMKEIKVMLLLNIYYEYYCKNELSSIETLLEAMNNAFQFSSDELRIFNVFLQPERFMIGYMIENDLDAADKYRLNNLFKLDCNDEFDLSLRHLLVNLIAMILLGGEESFLWTFAFQPLKLQNTYGK